ncbi:TrmH family RNA methyltransferase [Planctomicrobium sp. SH664]|uniref:TrmH family RNA methyltransferase n=1 Tax=Planctomicrobium sp. SH664 TaxID=3448125 RepID=UPI003F5C8F5A
MPPYELALYRYLQQIVTPRRMERFDEVLRRRTRWVTVVLADLYQQHNASAILRTCEAFGIQNVHIAETEHEFETNPEISLGTDRWLTLQHYRGPDALPVCLDSVKKAGYRVVATVVSGSSRPIQELPLDRPVALCFGTEKQGLPSEAIAAADLCVHLPMYGFVESFNVSVAAALCLQETTRRLHAGQIPWQLSEREHKELQLEWAKRSVVGADVVEKRFRSEWEQGLHRDLPASDSSIPQAD